MTHHPPPVSRSRLRRAFTAIAAGALLLPAAFVGATPAYAATQVDLGTATSFAVLAGTTVTNTGPSVINGDLGLSPGTSVTGFPPGIVNGVQHVTNATAAQAKADLTTAYNAAAGQALDTNLTGQDLGGLTLTDGVYKYDSSAFLTGTLTLDAQNNPDAVFLFQIGSTLITAPNSSVVLTNGARPCNVFYQVGSSATLDTNTTFVGNILALTSITANTTATVDGRLLAQNGAVTLDTNVITRSLCGTVEPPAITVTKTALPTSLPAPGGPFTFTATVQNTGTTDVTLTTLTDSISGNLNGVGTCTTGVTITAGSTYSCQFTRIFTGTAGASETNTVSATVTGPGGSGTASASDDATVTITQPAPITGQLKICKKADNAHGAVTGNYTFTYGDKSVTIPVGTCSGPLTVPAGNLTVKEVPKSGVEITACRTDPSSRLVTCNPGASSAVVKIIAGGSSNQTVLTITNRLVKVKYGDIKVCKIAGKGITVGTPFTFDVGGKSISVPAGKARDGGYCKVVTSFTVGGNVTVKEAAKSGVTVKEIAVYPSDRKISTSTSGRSAVVKVGTGITKVTFTNAAKRHGS